MTKAIEVADATAIKWRTHALAEQAATIADDDDQERILAARRALAERYPGCARAILSNDPVSNWDRGQLMQNELSRMPARA